MVDEYGNEQPDDWFNQNPPPPPPPTAPQNPGPSGVGDPGNDWNQIQGWASQFLGHPFDQATLEGLKGQPLDLVMHNIANSEEARLYANRGTGGGNGNGGGGGLLGGLLAPFTGTWSPIAAAHYEKPPAFAYDKMPTFKPFEKPTLDEAKQEPGFDLAVQMGNQGIQNSAAGRGLLRSGGTLKDILQWNQNFGNQNYQNVYNRDLNAWSANTSGAMNNWMTGLTGATSIYNTNYKSQYTDPYAFASQEVNTNNDNSWKNFLQQYDIFRNNQNDPYNKLADQQRIGLSAAQ